MDYDLDQYGCPIRVSGCGGDVVSWMVKQGTKFSHTLVVVHSANEDGATVMLRKLQKNGIAATRIPFVWEKPADLDRLTRDMR